MEKLGRQHPNQVMEIRTISGGVSDKDTRRPEDAVRTKRHFWDLPSKCNPKSQGTSDMATLGHVLQSNQLAILKPRSWKARKTQGLSQAEGH